MLSPLVPTREIHFLRYCAQNSDDGSWAIVDFPLDSFHETYQASLTRYKRRPSGCIIQDMPNGYSSVRNPYKILIYTTFLDVKNINLVIYIHE